MPTGISLGGLNGLEEPNAGDNQRRQSRDGIGMDEKAENGINFFPSDEPNKPNQNARIDVAAGIQSGNGNAAVAQLIRHRSPAVEAGHVNVEIRIAVKPDGQLPHDARRSADLQIGDEKKYSPLHRGKFTRIPANSGAGGRRMTGFELLAKIARQRRQVLFGGGIFGDSRSRISSHDPGAEAARPSSIM
jgi:hypothetical protein